MEEKGNEQEEVVEDEGVLGKTTREEGLALDSSESCREGRRQVRKALPISQTTPAPRVVGPRRGTPFDPGVGRARGKRKAFPPEPARRRYSPSSAINSEPRSGDGL